MNIKYAAVINTPGYSPWADEPAIFDTAHEAWSYLAEERERAEDDFDGEDYSPTREQLAVLGTAVHWQTHLDGFDGPEQRAAWLADKGLAPDGTGTVYGDTPGYDGDHDLGVAYSVVVAEDDDQTV